MVGSSRHIVGNPGLPGGRGMGWKLGGNKMSKWRGEGEGKERWRGTKRVRGSLGRLLYTEHSQSKSKHH